MQEKKKETAVPRSRFLLLKRFVLCLFVSFLFMKSTAGIYWDEYNRFLFHWSRWDAVGILLSIAVVGACFFAGYLVLGRFGRVGAWVLDVVFVAVAAFYLKVNLAEILADHPPAGPVVAGVLKCLLIPVAVLLLWRRRKTARVAETVCMVLSPILVIYAFVLLTARTYESTRGPEPTATVQQASGSDGPRVLVFLFDEWSYEATFDGKEQPLARFPQLARVVSNSIVLHEAYSPANGTVASLPPTLAGVSAEWQFVDETYYLIIDGKKTLVGDTEHVFKLMAERGYRTSLDGECLPFAELFPDGLHNCKSTSLYKPLGGGAWAVATVAILKNIHIRFGRFCPLLDQPYYLVRHRGHIERSKEKHEDALLAATGHNRQFAMIHYGIPHYPFVHNREGPKDNLGQAPGVTRSGYLEAMEYADRLMGELYDAVEGSQKDGETICIFLSDHGIRHPSVAGHTPSQREMCHVPVVVHYSGQTNRVDVNTPFSTSFLPSVLTACVDSQMNYEELANACGVYGPEDVVMYFGTTKITLASLITNTPAAGATTEIGDEIRRGYE
jgi:hypothetical protein